MLTTLVNINRGAEPLTRLGGELLPFLASRCSHSLSSASNYFNILRTGRGWHDDDDYDDDDEEGCGGSLS